VEERGRKSVAELAILVPIVPGVLPDPPADLTEPEAVYWRDVTATKPAEWWQADSEILLKSYCRASVQHDRISAAINGISAAKMKSAKGWRQYQSMRRVQASTSIELCTLAMKLRLCPSARYKAERANTIDRKVADDNKHPWQQRRSA
jgi:hypothetical protein